ncbi:hypothetical protein ACQ4PT_062835 [Festuca glaucescens]
MVRLAPTMYDDRSQQTVCSTMRTGCAAMPEPDSGAMAPHLGVLPARAHEDTSVLLTMARRSSPRSSYFSVEINHGGYFLGEGKNISYVSGVSQWFDQVDSVTWSALMLENLIEDMGYEMSGRITMHYCDTFLSVSSDGLRKIRGDEECQAMLSFLGMGQHFFSLFLDHDDSLRARNWDDVVDFLVIDLPPVISPAKPTGNREGNEVVGSQNSDLEPVPLQVISPLQVTNVADNAAARTRKRRLAAVEKGPIFHLDEAETEDDEQDSDFDPTDIVDSELDVSDGDDDLFEDNVENSEDEEVKLPKGQGREKAKAEKIQEAKEMAFKEEDSEDDQLWGPDTDIDAIHTRFKMFRQENLHNPKFFVGQCFESVEMLRKAIQVYSCINRQALKLPVNDKKRLNAKCSEGCKRNLWVSMSSISKCFMIKNFCGEHNHSCSRTFKVHAFTSKFLAERYLESFRVDQDMNMKNFSRIIQKDWYMTPGRSKLQRARRLAMKVIYGDEEGQYKLLWDYANEIRRSNPRSSFFLSLDENSRFQRCYMFLDASKRGFLQGCRPMIFVDDCFIKTRYRGQLLTAVGMDPNDCIFPIAVAAVEVEDTTNWTWFLESLKHDLGIVNTHP